jgi:DNA-binding transcriptional LysR family regulator
MVALPGAQGEISCFLSQYDFQAYFAGSMELRHLRYFVAAAEEENISRAALRLHISQSAISRQIRDLEDEISLRLFERRARALSLTVAGRKFLEEARSVLRHAEEAVARTKSWSETGIRELHVGYAPSPTTRILPRALEVFREKNPKIQLHLYDISTAEMLLLLREKKLHVALTVLPARKHLRGLDYIQIASYPLCIALASKHPLSKLKTLKPEQFVEEPFIGYTRKEYPEYEAWVKKLFNNLGRSPARIVEEYDSFSGIVAAVASGRGVALMPSVARSALGPAVKLIRLQPALEQLIVAIWYKQKTTPETVSRFVSALLEK